MLKLMQMTSTSWFPLTLLKTYVVWHRFSSIVFLSGAWTVIWVYKFSQYLYFTLLLWLPFWQIHLPFQILISRCSFLHLFKLPNALPHLSSWFTQQPPILFLLPHRFSLGSVSYFHLLTYLLTDLTVSSPMSSPALPTMSSYLHLFCNPKFKFIFPSLKLLCTSKPFMWVISGHDPFLYYPFTLDCILAAPYSTCSRNNTAPPTVSYIFCLFPLPKRNSSQSRIFSRMFIFLMKLLF